jgi:hypothetical protein
MMRIISFNVKDLDKFTELLKSKGYSVEYGPHAVLLDHSELSTITVKKNNDVLMILIAHYITPYYRVEVSGVSSEDEYLEKLISVKHSGEKWSIPVNPLIALIYNNELLDLVSNYSDSYPISDGEKLVKYYREHNPGYENIPKILVARLIERLRSGK